MSGRAMKGRIERIQGELRVALQGTAPGDLRAWGWRSAGRVPRGTGRRIGRLAQVVGRVVVGSCRESASLAVAASNGVLREHARERAGAAAGAVREFAVGAGRSAAQFAKLVPDLGRNPAGAAPVLLGSVVGFLAGSGGLDTDGGVPDLDLQFGIGVHRSILTHSIIGGALAEAAILSTLDLVALVHQRLPADRDPYWDGLLRMADLFADAMRRGTDAGIALHLGADGAGIDGMTPLKGLPVSLPMEGHRAILLANAAGEAATAVEEAPEPVRAPSAEARPPSPWRLVEGDEP